MRDTYYDFDIEGTELNDYFEDDENVVIPYGITQINSQAFYNKKFKTITFPTTLRTICFGAFEKCEELEVLNLNYGLTTIEYEAFRDCKKLREISIPSSLDYMEQSVFAGCKKVELVNCNGNSKYSYVDGCLIEDGDTIIESFGHKIPENPSITNIAEGAFVGYGYFHVTIPENIKNISSFAFTDCEGVESIRIQHDVHVEMYAFKSDNLTQIELSSKCKNIEERAFSVPHNNMLNVYVDDTEIPEEFDYVVDFMRYNHFCGKLIDPRMKSGTHCLWASDEWAKSNGTIFPKINVIHKGKYGDVYFVGYGFNTLDSSVTIAIYVDTERLGWLDKRASKIKLVGAEIDGVNYIDTYDIFGYHTADVSEYFHNVFYIDSDELAEAAMDAKEIHLDFDLLDSAGNFLEGFGMDVFLK